jgi:hypothetical protein
MEQPKNGNVADVNAIASQTKGDAGFAFAEPSIALIKSLTAAIERLLLAI